jgi:hypothetical protein
MALLSHCNGGHWVVQLSAVVDPASCGRCRLQHRGSLVPIRRSAEPEHNIDVTGVPWSVRPGLK